MLNAVMAPTLHFSHNISLWRDKVAVERRRQGYGDFVFVQTFKVVHVTSASLGTSPSAAFINLSLLSTRLETHELCYSNVGVR